MLFMYFVPSLLATAAAAVAMPVDDVVEFDEDVVHFKRDHVLETRDLELAEMHGVDLTQMYKHAMVKRDDGDHVIIWVDNSFNDTVPDESEGLSKRMGVRTGKDSRFDSGVGQIDDFCRNHDRTDWTHSGAPYSGGVHAMYQWARASRAGNWPVPSGRWQNLLVAGSNSGANALYRVYGRDWPATSIGTKDVRNDADWTRKRARKFGNAWRAGSHGAHTCGVHFRVRHELLRTKYDV